ncbi:MAG: hypothetical protein IPM29_18200 [Planctomycetes bacterium]|nr:hypothetical protein [Planctomycetota bacterium]
MSPLSGLRNRVPVGSRDAVTCTITLPTMRGKASGARHGVEHRVTPTLGTRHRASVEINGQVHVGELRDAHRDAARDRDALRSQRDSSAA